MRLILIRHLFTLVIFTDDYDALKVD